MIGTLACVPNNVALNSRLVFYGKEISEV